MQLPVNQSFITSSKRLTPPSPSIMSFVFEIFHALQACGSAYTGLLSAMAIYHLQKREGQAETAAQYSSVAGHRLHKTRTTQFSGVLAVSQQSGLSRLHGPSVGIHFPPVTNPGLADTILIGLVNLPGHHRVVRWEHHGGSPQCR